MNKFCLVSARNFLEEGLRLGRRWCGSYGRLRFSEFFVSLWNNAVFGCVVWCGRYANKKIWDVILGRRLLFFVVDFVVVEMLW